MSDTTWNPLDDRNYRDREEKKAKRKAKAFSESPVVQSDHQDRLPNPTCSCT